MEGLIEFVRAKDLVNMTEHAPKKPPKLTKWEREQSKEAAKGTKRVVTGEAKAPSASPKKAEAAAKATASPFPQGAGASPSSGSAASPAVVGGKSPFGPEPSTAGTSPFGSFGTALM